MKKTILTFVALFLATLTYAQSGINYKALITDNGNALNIQPITIKFTILQNGTTSVYQETQTITTDANGIVSVQIGEGTQVSGDFSTIDFATPQSLKVEIDSGSGFVDFGTNPLQYVPKAKYADKAGSVDYSNITNVPAGIADGDDVNDADHDPSNELQTLTFDNATRSLTITNGNSVTIPAGGSTGGDGWGTQIAATNGSINGDGTSASPLGVNTNDAAFNGWDKNSADDFDGDFTHLTNVPTGLSDGDDDTHLTDAQIAAMGYTKNTSDADFYTATTTNQPTNITDAIYHTGKIAIGTTNADAVANDQLTVVTDVTNGYAITAKQNNTDNSERAAIHAVMQTDKVVSKLATFDSTYGAGYVGLENTLHPGVGNMAYGVFNDIDVDNSNQSYGLVNSIHGEVDNKVSFGVFNSIYVTTDNEVDGVVNIIGSPGSGTRYGTWNYISSDGTGSHYAVYGEVDGTAPAGKEYFAGYFVGDVNITQNLKIEGGNPGAGKVLTSDADGLATWETPTIGVTQLNDLADAKSDNDGSDNGSSLFIGVDAGASDDATNNNNVGIGYKSLTANTTGNSNTAYGYYSLKGNTIGYDNTGIGLYTLYSNTSGNYNTAIGSATLESNTTGSHNTATGFIALRANSTGMENVANGIYALENNTTGNYNTASGSIALANNKANNGSVAYGYRAMQNADDRTTGRYTYNTAIGYESLKGSATPANNTGQYNTALGYQTMLNNTSGEKNVAVGDDALKNNTTGYNNTANGHWALANNTTGYDNTAIGNNALHDMRIGIGNAAFGAGALGQNTSSYNTSVGNSTLVMNTDGNNNVAFGAFAGAGNQGNNNVFIGEGAGQGSMASPNNGSGNIFIGNKAGANEINSNKLYIANSNTADPLIYGEFDNNKVKVNGELKVTEKLVAADSGDADMKAYVYGYVYYSSSTSTTIISTDKSSSGFTATKPDVGKFRITFTDSSIGTNYIMVANVDSTSPRFVTVDYQNGYCNIYIYNISGNAIDDQVHFVVYRK